jgi:hypothetical protein
LNHTVVRNSYFSISFCSFGKVHDSLLCRAVIKLTCTWHHPNQMHIRLSINHKDRNKCFAQKKNYASRDIIYFNLMIDRYDKRIRCAYVHYLYTGSIATRPQLVGRTTYVLSRTHHVRTLHLSVHGNENESLKSEGSSLAIHITPAKCRHNLKRELDHPDVHTASPGKPRRNSAP